jgi:chorismate mutase
MATDPNVDYVVRQMRDAIVDTDLKLLQAVNQRLSLVAKLRAYKRDQGMPFLDPEREVWMHRYLQAANRGPISEKGLRELYDHLLELTKQETAAAEAERAAKAGRSST